LVLFKSGVKNTSWREKKWFVLRVHSINVLKIFKLSSRKPYFNPRSPDKNISYHLYKETHSVIEILLGPFSKSDFNCKFKQTRHDSILYSPKVYQLFLFRSSRAWWKRCDNTVHCSTYHSFTSRYTTVNT